MTGSTTEYLSRTGAATEAAGSATALVESGQLSVDDEELFDSAEEALSQASLDLDAFLTYTQTHQTEVVKAILGVENWEEVNDLLGSIFDPENQATFHKWLQGSAELVRTAATIIFAFDERVDQAARIAPESDKQSRLIQAVALVTLLSPYPKLTKELYRRRGDRIPTEDEEERGETGLGAEQIQAMEAQLERLKTDIADKDRELEQLRINDSMSNDLIDTLFHEQDSKTEIIEKLKVKLEGKKQELEQLQVNLEAEQAKSASLQEQVDGTQPDATADFSFIQKLEATPVKKDNLVTEVVPILFRLLPHTLITHLRTKSERSFHILQACKEALERKPQSVLTAKGPKRALHLANHLNTELKKHTEFTEDDWQLIDVLTATIKSALQRPLREIQLPADTSTQELYFQVLLSLLDEIQINIGLATTQTTRQHMQTETPVQQAVVKKVELDDW